MQQLAPYLSEGQRLNSYRQRSDLGLFSLECRGVLGELIEPFKVAKGLTEILPETLFQGGPDSGIRGHGRNLANRRCQRAAGANFFSERLDNGKNGWNELARGAVETDRAKTFKQN